MILEKNTYKTKIVIHANGNTVEKILSALRKKYSNNDIKYYIEKPLSKREKEIMKLIIEGDTNKDISKKLKISVNTVKAHISKILEKLSVKDRVQAVVKVICGNLLI